MTTDSTSVQAALATQRIETAVLGLRQLRHPLQGVRPAGGAPRRLREGLRRRPGAPPHRDRADRRAAHPLGQGRRLRPAGRARRRTTASPSAPSTPTSFQDDDYKLGSVATPTPRPRARPSTTCSSASTSWTSPARRTSSCGSPTAPTTRARTTSRPPAPPRRRPARRSTPGSATTSGCVLEYKFFEPAFYATDVPDWGTAFAHCLTLGPKAHGGASTPATTRPAPTSSSS